MREPVTIVLNEREANKARAAEVLQRTLQDLGITASRLEIDEHIEDTILKKAPRVLVLDYLLGDYSTGLDVLQGCLALPELKRPTVFFLTDEPSVQVAVEAMRMGARNYLEIDSPQALLKVAKEISSILTEDMLRTRRHDPEPSERATLDDLVAQSKTGRQLMTQAHAHIQAHLPVVCILGRSGTGRTTLARALQNTARTAVNLRTLDLGLCDQPLALTTGLDPDAGGPKLGHDLALIVEHAEDDGAELLQLVEKNFKRLSRKDCPACTLIITTDSADLARAWQRVVPDLGLLNLPDLSERKEDIAPLTQRFMIEAQELSGQKLKNLEAGTVAALADQDWPGHIKQLRTVIVAAALASTKDSRSLPELIEDLRELWSVQHTSLQPSSQVELLSAAMTLESCNHNYRVAAARLGLSVRHLAEMLTAEHAADD